MNVWGQELFVNVNEYLPLHDTAGLTIEVMPPVEAVKYSMARAREGKDTISVTGNVRQMFDRAAQLDVTGTLI